MMCYRDMTFCKAENCVKFNECPRALTEQVKQAAERWMKDAPIAVFTAPPSCFQEAAK